MEETKSLSLTSAQAAAKTSGTSSIDPDAYNDLGDNKAVAAFLGASSKSMDPGDGEDFEIVDAADIPADEPQVNKSMRGGGGGGGHAHKHKRKSRGASAASADNVLID